MSEMVTVTFNENYIASRGAGIAGAKGAKQTLRMTDQVKDLIDRGILSVERKTQAAKRSKAKKNDADE